MFKFTLLCLTGGHQSVLYTITREPGKGKRCIEDKWAYFHWQQRVRFMSLPNRGRSNLTACTNNLKWNGKQWSIVNHFIPFTEEVVGSPDRFESDFMVRYLATSPLTPLQGRGEDSTPSPSERVGVRCL